MKYIGEALEKEKWKIPHGEIYLIKDRCKGCNLCIEFCPEDALEESPEFNAKGYHPPRLVEKNGDSACVGCGFCEQVCPEFAIYSVKEEEIEKRRGKNQ